MTTPPSASFAANGAGTWTFASGVTVPVPPLTRREAIELLALVDRFDRGDMGAGLKVLEWFGKHVSDTALDGLSLTEQFQEALRFFLHGRTGKVPAPDGPTVAGSRSGSSATSAPSSTPARTAGPLAPTPPGGNS